MRVAAARCDLDGARRIDLPVRCEARTPVPVRLTPVP